MPQRFLTLFLNWHSWLYTVYSKFLINSAVCLKSELNIVTLCPSGVHISTVRKSKKKGQTPLTVTSYL
jgi:hypothetical protein